MELKMMPMDAVLADHEFNCRGQISTPDVADLIKDIRLKGLIQPITIGPYDEKTGKHLLIAGYRRYTACTALKWDVIPAVIREDMGQELEARIFNLCENLARRDLNILQEAHAIKHLYDLGLSYKDTAVQLSQSTGWVKVRFMLLDLPEDVQTEILMGNMTQTEIRRLHKVYEDAGLNGVHTAVKKLKDSKFRLGALRLNDHQKKRDERLAKKVRSREEIFKMIEHLLPYEENLASRALAWASGEICSKELYVDVKAAVGPDYVEPMI